MTNLERKRSLALPDGRPLLESRISSLHVLTQGALHRGGRILTWPIREGHRCAVGPPSDRAFIKRGTLSGIPHLEHTLSWERESKAHTTQSPPCRKHGFSYTGVLKSFPPHSGPMLRTSITLTYSSRISNHGLLKIQTFSQQESD